MPDEPTRSASSRQLCRRFLKGSCPDGERCRYLHTGNLDSIVRYVRSFLNPRLTVSICRRPLLLVLEEQDDAGGIGVIETFHPQKHMRHV